MSNKPRTPEYFPNMKHRAAGRVTRKQVQHTTDILHVFALRSKEIVEGINRMSAALNAFSKTVRQGMGEVK